MPTIVDTPLPGQGSAYLSAPFWSIDSVNGSDSAAGYGSTLSEARSRPIKTLRELDRRMLGSDISSVVVFSIENDIPPSDSTVLKNLRSFHGTGLPIFIGKKRQIGNDYTVTAYAGAVPAANTGYLLSAVGLGAAGNLGKLVSNASETCWAFIQDNPGADQVRLTNVNDFNQVTFTGGFSASFSVGDTVRVWNLPVLQQYPFGTEVQFPAIDTCHIKGGFSTGLSDTTNLGASSPLIAHSIIDGVSFQGGVQGVISGCLFSLTASSVSAASSTTYIGCGVRGTNLLMTGGVPLLSANTDFQNARLSLSDHCLAFFNDPTASLSAFSVPAAIPNGSIVFCNAGASLNVFNSSSQYYGSGNTAKIYVAGKGSSGAIAKSTTTVVTTDPSPITLAGAGHVVADIPISDAITGSFINDGL